MTSLKTSIKTITYLSDTGCLEIQGASLVALITIGLLFIGVLNAPINTYEMVIYPIAFFVCLFGQMRLFRSA
ncbi:inner membrane protein [Escherichia coli]|nr:inner membrane protein [Escherichia coli]